MADLTFVIALINVRLVMARLNQREVLEVARMKWMLSKSCKIIRSSVSATNSSGCSSKCKANKC